MSIRTDPIKAIQSVLACVGGRPIVGAPSHHVSVAPAGVLFEAGSDGIFIVATNGFSIAVARTARCQNFANTTSVVVPQDVLTEALAADAFRIEDAGTRIKGTKGLHPHMKQAFPNWRRALPQDYYRDSPPHTISPKRLARVVKWANGTPCDIVDTNHPQGAALVLVRGEDDWLCLLQSDDVGPKWLTKQRMRSVSESLGLKMQLLTGLRPKE